MLHPSDARHAAERGGPVEVVQVPAQEQRQRRQPPRGALGVVEDRVGAAQQALAAGEEQACLVRV